MDSFKHFTPAEVADQLGVSVDTVRVWINCRELNAVNFGSNAKPRYGVSQKALATFLDARKLPAKPKATRREGGAYGGSTLPRTFV